MKLVDLEKELCDMVDRRYRAESEHMGKTVGTHLLCWYRKTCQFGEGVV